MRRFWSEAKRHIRNFFTNWHEYDAPMLTKLRLTIRNRFHATFGEFRSAVQKVLNNIAAYSDELASLMTERFQLFTAS